MVWGAECTNYPSELNKAIEDFRSSAQAQRTSLGARRGAVLGKKIDLEVVARQAELLLLADPKREAFLAFEKSFDAALDAYLVRLEQLERQLNAAEAVVDRWAQLKTLKPQPVLEQRFLVGQGSERYTVEVLRTPVNGRLTTPAPEGKEENPPAPEADVVASVAFEGHAPHRFNFTLGLAAFYEPSSNFAILPKIVSDSTEFAVREIEGKGWEVRPVATIGVYFEPVDNFDSDRPPALMALMGTEIGGGFDTFLLGVGLDFRSGLVLQAGLSRYEDKRLPPGVAANMPVPKSAEGAPVISDLSLRDQPGVGAFFTIGFRPSIIQEFFGVLD